MQYIAIFSMLVDHVGLIFFPDSEIWRIIGRLAFPIYAYGIVAGMGRTKSLSSYIGRLALIGAIAQGGFFALGLMRPNVIFSFIAAIAVFWLLDRYKGGLFRSAVFVVVVAAAFEVFGLEYGAYGFLLMVLYRYTKHVFMIAGHAALNYIFGMLLYGDIQMFSIISSVIIVLIPSLQRFRVPNWLWRSFYPAHLLGIAGLKQIFEMFTAK